ncbi:unnamed protein product [Rotaria sordida]|uniref:BED-type domain-containing protein n=1 Tax=Rotaria sordida TaxID=392033 RepID=A0A819FPS7_9BILA|nr:unnamed protein product [Rotaria sordida]CAF3871977.1 unnamed protein product [Rotaria sordida]
MSKQLLTGKELEKLIKDNDPSIKFVEKKKTSKSSEYWGYFHIIFFNNDRQEYVSCNKCKKLLFHKSSNGTNNLRTHANSCPNINKTTSLCQKTVHDFYSSLKQSPIPKKIKLSITEACTEFCALDGRAFDVMKGNGFKKLVKTVFDAGRLTNKSSIDVTDLLPHPTTISRNVTQLYEQCKVQLIDICEKLTSFCLIVDNWTETYTGISYCGIALRYVGGDHQLFTFILGCFPYNGVSHSSQHLREFVDKILQEYKLTLDPTKFVVTDNEPKMLSAFREKCFRIGCADHYLNKQLQHAFQSTEIHVNKNSIEKVECELAQDLFLQVKQIVSFVRRSHQQQKLSKKLQTYSESRFAGAIIMLDLFQDCFFQLPEIILNSKMMDNYNLIDKELLDDICKFLEPFQEVIDSLNVDQEPTLHRVIPLRQYLIKKCDVQEGDSVAIIQLKIFLARRIQSAWFITDYHRLSTILHPKLKNFDFCIHEKDKSISVLKEEFEKFKLINSSSCKNVINSTQVNINDLSTTNSTTPKRKNLLAQCFDSRINTISSSSNVYQEVDDYLAADFSQSFSDRDDCDDIDVLLFWRQQQHLYPTLSSIAKVVCAVPASNTVIERLFSAAKNVVTEKRTRLDSEKINQLLFLQKNMKTLKELSSNDFQRKRTTSMTSTARLSPEESSCTSPKQLRLDINDSDHDSDKENILD